jgi:hypothetical protein
MTTTAQTVATEPAVNVVETSLGAAGLDAGSHSQVTLDAVDASQEAGPDTAAFPPVTLDPPGGVPWEELVVPPAAADECRVSADEDLPPVTNLQGSDELWSFDLDLLLLTRLAADGDAYVEQQFDSEGGLLLLNVSSGAGMPISVEYVRDAQGNTTSRVSGDNQTGYSLSYDPDTGLLSRSSISYPYLLSRVYTHDTQGRCESVSPLDGSQIEQWYYTETGPLDSRLTLDAEGLPVAAAYYVYDANGTWQALIEDGANRNDSAATVDGIADRLLRRKADGSGGWWLELFEFSFATEARNQMDPDYEAHRYPVEGNALVTRDGFDADAYRARWHFSAGCAELIEQLPKPHDQRCRFDQPELELPLGWW